jgi:transcriptional regulator with XRE-family HTH domain
MGFTTDQLAEAAGIDKNRLASVRAGRIRMSGDDLLGLSMATGIPMKNIQTSKELQ